MVQCRNAAVRLTIDFLQQFVTTENNDKSILRYLNDKITKLLQFMFAAFKLLQYEIQDIHSHGVIIIHRKLHLSVNRIIIMLTFDFSIFHYYL